MRWIGLAGVSAAYSQPLYAPRPFFWGASWGIGGVHLWARPAAALRYDRTFWHFSPFPPYLSLGVSQIVGYFQARERRDRPLYLALHGHWRYLPMRDLRYDRRITSLGGVRLWLEPYLQRFYLQVGVGITFHQIARRLWYVWPTGEVQLGGFYRPHRYVPKRLHHTRPYR